MVNLQDRIISMLELKIKEVDNGYIIYHLPEQQGYICREQYVATDVHALGLLIKQLAGAEKHRQCQARKKK